MNPETFGPAFPCASDVNPEGNQSGMTLRDYFAAKAVNGILSAAGDIDGAVQYDADRVARSAYEMADAMLTARQQVRS